MRIRRITVLFSLIILNTMTSAVFSQEAGAQDTSRNNAVKIFLDCNDCDMECVSQEISYINYVRDVKES